MPEAFLSMWLKPTDSYMPKDNSHGIRTAVRDQKSLLDLRCSIIPCETMALGVGTQLGSHEITALLGKGRMGEVYRACHLKLKRAC
jgi:hypothetical protein